MMSNIVPGNGPRNCRVAVVGHIVGEDEEKFGVPMCGPSGELMNDILRSAGLRRTLTKRYTTGVGFAIDVDTEVYVTNVTKRYLGKDDKRRNIRFEDVYLEDRKGTPKAELLQCYEELAAELSQTTATVFIATGEHALRALARKYGINKWRGSVLECTLVPGRKVVPMLHSAELFQGNMEYKPVCVFDAKRAKRESQFPEIRRPQRTFTIKPTLSQVIAWEERMTREEWCSFDIETLYGGGHILCIGFAPNEREGICIPLVSGMHHYWSSPEDEVRVWRAIERILAAPSKKVAQNCLFDLSHLAAHGIAVNNMFHDTMLCSNIIYPELEKSLAFLCSLYTEEPYYKEEGRKALKNKKSDKETWTPEMFDDQLTRLSIYNCLMKGNRILFADGTTEEISEIVTHKIEKDVLSYNEQTNQIESKPITGWHRTRNKLQLWVRIKLDRSEASKRGLVVTPEHKVRTSRGWIAAQEVHVGDRIYINEQLLTMMQLQVLIGTVLGDGYLASKNGNLAELVTTSTIQEYANWKRSMLGGSVTPTVKEGFGKPCLCYDLRLPYSAQQRDLQRIFYDSDGVKHIPLEAVKTLDDLGFAVWYMDDGCLVGGQDARIATCCFSQTELQPIIEFLQDKFHGRINIIQNNSIAFGHDASEEFLSFIKRRVPKMFAYKLPTHLQGYFEELPSQISKGIYGELVTEVDNCYFHRGTGRGYNTIRYCLTVKDNHNFFTSNGLVANCRDATTTFEVGMGQIVDMREHAARRKTAIVA